jgi:hypothetical protein
MAHAFRTACPPRGRGAGTRTEHGNRANRFLFTIFIASFFADRDRASLASRVEFQTPLACHRSKIG